MKKESALPKTEVFALRLDPKLKYLAEIAARSQRRSLANFVVCAIAQSLRDVPMANEPGAPSIADIGSKLWDIDPATRLEYLAENYPDLLTYDERLAWGNHAPAECGRRGKIER